MGPGLVERSTRPAFPTTRHLLALVACSCVACAILAPLARRYNAADFSFLAGLLLLGGPSLLNLAIRLAEPPGATRIRHLLLGAVLAKFSTAAALLSAGVAVWAFGWADLPFFLRVEGRYWLVNWLALPLWIAALCRVVAALRRRPSGADVTARRKAIDERLAQLALATIGLAGAVGYWWLAPSLSDRVLLNLTRALATIGLLWWLLSLVPARCPTCSRRGMIRQPFAPRDVGVEDHQCLSCGGNSKRWGSGSGGGEEAGT